MKQRFAMLSLLVALAVGAALAPPPMAAPVAADAERPATPPTPTTEQATPPPPLPGNELRLPEIVEARLANGVQVVVVPKPGLPLLRLQLVLPGGGSAEPEQLAGLADFTAGLLTRGTTSRSAQEIAAAVEQTGGSLTATADQDSISVTASVLSEDADRAFELLGDVTLHPTFPEAELATYRQRALTSLRTDLADPGTVASRAFDAIVYGQHPYGVVSTARSLNAITRQTIVDYYSAEFHPDGAILVVVGDISPDDAVRRAETTFGQWPASGQAASPSYSTPPRRTQRTIYLVDRPGSSQAQIQLGHLGIRGTDPERYPLLVANQVLGGGSSSRLYRDLRETKGYTYGIYSYFTFPRDVGEFVVSAAVRNEVVEPALRATLAELEQLRDAPLPADELADAKSYLIGSYALRLETAQALASQIASLELRDLPLAPIAAYPRIVGGVDAEAARQAAQQYIRPDELAIVVVGDAGTIRAPLSGIAPVVMIDADGQPLGK